ncbi:MAG: pirin family protein [Micromonosporaceae bacterium]
MLTLRRAAEIFAEDGGWFQARWHFSFDRYHDPEQMGVGALRVFNDDRIVPGAAWPMHPHRDIESLTYVVAGHFEHADSLGNNGRLEPGGAQVMSFSHRGAMHSERNASSTEPMRFIQFWILPSSGRAESTVHQRQYTVHDRTDRWLQIMGPPGEEGLDLRQDARVRVSRMTAGNTLTHSFGEGRGGYLYVLGGSASLDGGEQIGEGDAAKVYGPHELAVAATTDAELINIDVPLDFVPPGVWAGRR